MKHYLFGVVAVLLVALGLSPVATADVNNFTITNFTIDYVLSRDSDGQSRLETTEMIIAEFPQSDQNHGLERVLISEYDGHSTSLSIDSVKDDVGQDLEYSTSEQNGTKVLRIGDPDAYVHGPKTYIITYTQRGVTDYFTDTGRDEFYWDTNGTGWRVRTGQLNVNLKIADDLVSHFSGDSVCYRGVSGSAATCDLVQTKAGVFSIGETNLAPGENVTIALGFQGANGVGGTFAAYQPTLFERLVGIWQIVQVAAAIIGVFITIILSVMWSRRKNRVKEVGTVIPEYIPPKDTSLTVAATTITPRGSVFAAQLLDLAVRHHIKIYETKEKTLFSQAEYDIELVSPLSKLQDEEAEIIRDMLSDSETIPGTRISLKALQTSTKYAMKTMDNDAKVQALVNGRYALRQKTDQSSRLFYRWSVAFLILAVITLSPVFIVFSVIAVVLGYTLKPLTDKGLTLRRYLMGLEMYIKVAEEERLKYLQGPDTAEKVGEQVDIHNSSQLVKLYERVLPYAVLFGQSKEWSKRLEQYYAADNTQPGWYSGSSVLHAAAFSGFVTNFSSSASVSAGYGSSSSGGSGGGGFSGGGGGGGGGGGW